MMLAITVEKLK